MAGGMRTQASRYAAGVAPVGVCSFCNSGDVPSLEHVLLDCEGFESCREGEIGWDTELDAPEPRPVYPKPASGLARRLGRPASP
eukprot:11835572-Alexandrium_andersonii.AAC.1